MGDKGLIRDVIAKELEPLVVIIAKLLRANFNTGPTAPIVRAWISQNPDPCIRVVEATAPMLGVKIDDMLDAMSADPDKLVALCANAAFAAAKARVGREGSKVPS